MRDRETIRSILERSSCRAYTDEPVSQAMREILEDAALATPTGRNKQELRFCFVTDRELIEAINQETLQVLAEDGRGDMKEILKKRQATSIFYGARLLVVISSKPSKYGTVDAGIGVQNLALAAQSLGLGSCINAMCERSFRRERPRHFCEAVGMEADERFEVAIAIGHKAHEKAPHRWDRSHIRQRP